MITKEKSEKNMEMVIKLISTFPEERKNSVNAMMDEIGEDYFTSPASSRESFHNAYPGGLCHHSLLTITNLWSLQKSLCKDKWDKHKLAFVGLFHDIGKIGVDGKKRYLVNDNNFQRTEWGRIYKINEEMEFLTPADASLYTLQQFGIKLDYEEWLAIKLNAGQYDSSNKDYMMNEPTLALMLHWAKRFAMDSK